MPDNLDPDRYDDVAEAFDRYTERTGGPLTECFVEMTGMRPGLACLDIACGSGTATRRAAEAVGPAGRVVGIDLSPGQLRTARRRGPDRIQYLVMDAMALDFEDKSFDIVTARYPHFPDRVGALREMARVLRPGGRVAICHGGGGQQRWPLGGSDPGLDLPAAASVDGLFLRLLQEILPEPSGGRAGNAPAAVTDPAAALEDDLRSAGFGDVGLWSYSYSSAFLSTEEAWEWETIRHSPYRMRAESYGEADVEALRTAYHAEASALLGEHGVLAMGTGAMFGVATRQ
jgi:SAM-dependent methyltransferase